MDRGVWRLVAEGLRRVPRRSPARARYSNRDVLAVLLWAALRDRPISWACRRSSWPMQAWRRRLPDQSTMSRRLREPELGDDLHALLAWLQRHKDQARTLIVDGKALPVREHSTDPDAATGWASGRYAPGYKLHALIDAAHRLVGFAVEPMNQGESVVARGLVERLTPGRRTTLLGDSAYDSNPLHAACADRGVRLLAPRRRPGTGVSKGHRQHRARLSAIDAIEGDRPPRALARRRTIERFFARLAIAGGLFALPPWVRRLRRVRLWVAAKLVLNDARIELAARVGA